MFAYGPVPSRRFGRSVGVSPIPAKVCSYSCVYCQLGRTRSMGIKRQSFFAKEAIFADIEKTVRANAGKIDVITFVGDGEPTLNSDLGWLLQNCAEKYSYRRAVITNGSLLWKEDVRRDLQSADIVNITVSAARADTFRKLHRPHGGLKFETVIGGIEAFAADFKGKIWAEVMLVDGVNTDSEELQELKTLINRIGFHKTFVMVPTRPPAESWVKIPSEQKVIEAVTLFQASDVTNVENGAFGLDEFQDAKEAIIETSHRHPLRKEQARAIEKHFKEHVLNSLIENGSLKETKYEGRIFMLPSEFVRK